MEALLPILLGLIIVAFLKLNEKPTARHDAENAEISDFSGPDDDRVHEIVKAAYLDLKRQRAGTHGPWLAALLDGGPELFFTGSVDKWGRDRTERQWRRVEPAVARTAIRFTIDELAGGRFDLDGLRRAEAELAEMEKGA